MIQTKSSRGRSFFSSDSVSCGIAHVIARLEGGDVDARMVCHGAAEVDAALQASSSE